VTVRVDTTGYGRAEPMWFRLGIAPDTPPTLVRDNLDIHRLYANELVGEDPQTAVFTAWPGEPVRGVRAPPDPPLSLRPCRHRT
jgi:hypothetical protein